jgi:hypothetical protein
MFDFTGSLIYDAANLLRKRLVSWLYWELDMFTAERQPHEMKPVYEANASHSNCLSVGLVTNSIARWFILQ